MSSGNHLKLTACLTPLLLVALGGPAAAISASATSVRPTSIVVPANVSFTIWTSDLVGSGTDTPDTVLHVQKNDANGSFAFGNDDEGPGLLSSRVVIPAASTEQHFSVIVRAYSNFSRGSANLNISGSDGYTRTYYAVRFAGYAYDVGSFPSQTHFWTVEDATGSHDTVLLVIAGTAERAVAYDDDDGVGNMSWVHIDPGCSSASGLCRVIVGHYPSTDEVFSTRLYLDTDVHFDDCDNDGLGDSLEEGLGTDICGKDTDADGLTDAQEVIGVVESETAPPVKLPTWGANPLVKDIFIEVDWVQTDDPDNLDRFRMPREAVADAQKMYPADIKLHFDTGVANENATTITDYGDWGGALAMPSGTGACHTLSPERRGLFHHYLAISADGGGQGYYAGYCAFGSHNGIVLAHELGHNLGIGHGGNTPSVTVNCKPHYRSFMNYAYVYRRDVDFSSNRFGSLVLNPADLNENVGLGTTDPAIMADMMNHPFRFKVNTATGAIDWNRDGVFSSSTKGAVTWNWGSGGCEQSWHHSDRAFQDGNGADLAWLPVSPPRYYYFSRRPSDGKIEYRFATTFACGTKPWQDGCANWSPALNAGSTLISSSQGGSGAPSVFAFNNNGPKLMLVYKGTDNKLRFQIGTPNASGTGLTWNAPALLSSMVVSSDPELVDTGPGNVLRVYARDSQTSGLRSWDYTAASNSWSGRWEQWNDNSRITVAEGVGITKGYLKGMSALQTMGAFPVPLTGGGNQIETARYDTTAGRWVRLGGWPGGRISSETKVSMAYAPYKKTASTTAGRYFITFTPKSGEAGRITMTEGNDLSATASNRRYRWLDPVFIVNTWGNTKTSIPLLYDLKYDSNLRSAFSFWYQDVVNNVKVDRFVSNFFPFADGISDLQLRDNDDLSYLRKTMACSIGKGTCPAL